MDSISSPGKEDLIETYAFPLPIIVIADLAGVPAEDVQIGGHLFKRGEYVIPIPTAADRDPKHFL